MSFNFNPKIDRDFINSMYEDDYLYISEIFQTTLSQLIPDIEVAKKAFEDGEVETLRKQVHKIKPAFGFVGLRGTETACQAFENECSAASSVQILHGNFAALMETLNDSTVILGEEIEKLKLHNN
jgi:HPt (histidine-containing phosphotransfer) domain-containing protein